MLPLRSESRCFMPRVLLLIPTKSYRTRAFMEAAERLQLEVVVGSDQSQVLAALTPDTSLFLDFQKLENAVDSISKASSQKPFDAVLGVDDDTVVLAAMANAALSLRHNSVESAQATRNKYLMREKLQFSNLLSPHFELVALQENRQKISQQIQYPCVLKPIFLSGSRGVIRANNAEEFLAACRKIEGLLARPEIAQKGGAFAEKILVEDYIDGIEVALEGLMVAGELKLLAFFDKPDPLVGPLFVETIYVTPSRLPQKTQEEIFYIAQQAAKALGLQEGPLHAELRFNETGVWPVEIAARSIGGLCSDILKFSQNRSLEELILLHAIGAYLPEMQHQAQPSGVLMLPVLQEGILEAVKGQAEAEAIPGIQNITISIPPGQAVEPLPYGDRYLGFIFAEGSSSQEIEEALRSAYQCLQVKISP